MARGGFLVMIVTGVLLFCGRSRCVLQQYFFKVKMLMLLLAGLNVWLFNATVGRKMAEWEIDAETPGRAKAAAVVSLVLWVAIVAADGRSRILCHPVGGSPGMSLSSLLMSFCEWADNSFFGHGIRSSVWLFPFVEIFHLLALACWVGQF